MATGGLTNEKKIQLPTSKTSRVKQKTHRIVPRTEFPDKNVILSLTLPSGKGTLGSGLQ